MFAAHNSLLTDSCGTIAALHLHDWVFLPWQCTNSLRNESYLALISEQEGSLKRVLSILLMVLTLAVVAGPIASAQTRRHRRVRHSRSFWQKHRDKLTVAGTAATGAGIGAIIGGKKGALIGTGAGAGSGALYTYKLRRRQRHRRHY